MCCWFIRRGSAGIILPVLEGVAEASRGLHDAPHRSWHGSHDSSDSAILFCKDVLNDGIGCTICFVITMVDMQGILHLGCWPQERCIVFGTMCSGDFYEGFISAMPKV